jgi:hypothetical protein
MDFEDVESCNSICTNNASGIGSYICDGNVVQKDVLREVCRWEQKEFENVSRNCNCEGEPILENCPLKMVKSTSDCSSLLSAKGSCFYNNNSDTESGMFVCADVLDITECGEIFNDTSCIYARKHTFRNLNSNSSISRAVFLCLWDVENRICRSKRLDAIDIIPENKNSFIIIVIKMRRRVNNRTKEYEISNDLLHATSLRFAEDSLPSSGLVNSIYIYALLMIFFLFV